MTKETWISFTEAVQLVRDRFNAGSIGRAEALVRSALASGEVRIERLPVLLGADDGLTNFDLRPGAYKVGPPPKRMSEADLLDWLRRNVPTTAVKAVTPKQREASRPLRDRAEQIIKILWPDGAPPATMLLNGPLVQQVCDWHKADCKKRQIKHVDLMRDTILRAAGRKK
jgi:hypothetical protein